MQHLKEAASQGVKIRILVLINSAEVENSIQNLREDLLRVTSGIRCRNGEWNYDSVRTNELIEDNIGELTKVLNPLNSNDTQIGN